MLFVFSKSLRRPAILYDMNSDETDQFFSLHLKHTGFIIYCTVLSLLCTSFAVLFALKLVSFFLTNRPSPTEKDAAAMQWYLPGKAEQTAESLISNTKTEPQPL